MNIGILAVDSNYPNLALMKISAWHKARGDNVEWYNPLCSYDKVYSAKVFSFTPDYGYYINADQVEKGGTGYDIKKVLLPEIDRMIPDYDLYNVDKNLAYGFLTRGCPNRCKWCVVPVKEGNITPYMDNGENMVTHLYDGNFENPGFPMCSRGWQRKWYDSNGKVEDYEYSIFRNLISNAGICKNCLRRARANLPSIKKPVNKKNREV